MANKTNAMMSNPINTWPKEVDAFLDAESNWDIVATILMDKTTWAA
jgi:hypothetical protein